MTADCDAHFMAVLRRNKKLLFVVQQELQEVLSMVEHLKTSVLSRLLSLAVGVSRSRQILKDDAG